MRDTAAGLAALGRGEDKMLVHMTPGEVRGLQAIALAHGGSLTINPHTGLPEAGFLKNILPALAAAAAVYFTGGAALGAGAGAAGAGAVTGAAGTAGLMGLTAAQTGALAGGVTGALTNKENPLQGALLGGLGGYGIGGGMGAGMQSGLFGGGAEAAGAGGIPLGPDVSSTFAIPAPDAGTTSVMPPASGAMPAAAPPVTPQSSIQGGTLAENFRYDPLNRTNVALPPNVAPLPAPSAVTSTMAQQQATDMATPGFAGDPSLKPPSFMQALGQQFPSTGSKVAAGLGTAGTLGAFDQPELNFAAPEQGPSNYRKQGPSKRPYDPSAPGGYYFTDRGILQPNFPAAKGGEVPSVPELEDGGFVLTKRAVDGIGGGSNNRGQRAAAAGLGSIPIRGPGTGTSDSIPTTIEGRRPALLSNGEAYVPRDQVKRRGGAKKFYALMKQAEKSARRA